MQALEALRLPVDHWDAILVYWLLDKLNAESRKQFELAHPGTDVLTFKELTTFMDRRSRALESSGDQPEASTPKRTPKKVLEEAYSSTVDHSTSCQMKERNGSHSISQCDRYKQLGTREGKTVVRKLKLCMNCLGRHFVADCLSKFSCRTCSGRHHTSLHFDRPVEQQSGVTSGATFSGSSVLLSTAMVGIDDTAGNTLMFRALLDSGFQNILHHSKGCIKPQSCTFNSRREDLWDWWTATSSQGVYQSPSWSTKVACYSTSAELNRR